MQFFFWRNEEEEKGVYGLLAYCILWLLWNDPMPNYWMILGLKWSGSEVHNQNKYMKLLCKYRFRVFFCWIFCAYWHSESYCRNFSWSLKRTVDHQNFYQILSVECRYWNSSRSLYPSCGQGWRPSWCGPSGCWSPDSQSSSWRWSRSGSPRWSWSSPLPGAIETSEVC